MPPKRSLSQFGRVEALAFRRKLQRETVRRWPHEHYVQPCLPPMAGGQVAAVRPSCPTPADGGSVAGYGRHGDPRSLPSRRQPTLTHFQWFREAIGFSRWSVHSPRSERTAGRGGVAPCHGQRAANAAGFTPAE